MSVHDLVVGTLYVVAVGSTIQTIIAFFTSKPFNPWTIVLGLISVAAITLAIYANFGSLVAVFPVASFLLLAFVVLWAFTLKRRQLRHKSNG